MEARVGTLPVGALFDTLLTGRRGVVRAHGPVFDDGICEVESGETLVRFLDATSEHRTKRLHSAVRVRVVGVTH